MFVIKVVGEGYYTSEYKHQSEMFLGFDPDVNYNRVKKYKSLKTANKVMEKLKSKYSDDYKSFKVEEVNYENI